MGGSMSLLVLSQGDPKYSNISDSSSISHDTILAQNLWNSTTHPPEKNTPHCHKIIITNINKDQSYLDKRSDVVEAGVWVTDLVLMPPSLERGGE